MDSVAKKKNRNDFYNSWTTKSAIKNSGPCFTYSPSIANLVSNKRKSVTMSRSNETCVFLEQEHFQKKWKKRYTELGSWNKTLQILKEWYFSTLTPTWCAAAGVTAGGRSSRSTSSGRVWYQGGCAGAGTGRRRWRTSWSNGDTCGVWPLCGTWSESASQTWLGRWAGRLCI